MSSNFQLGELGIWECSWNRIKDTTQSARRLDISLNFVMDSTAFFFPGTKVRWSPEANSGVRLKTEHVNTQKLLHYLTGNFFSKIDGRYPWFGRGIDSLKEKWIPRSLNPSASICPIALDTIVSLNSVFLSSDSCSTAASGELGPRSYTRLKLVAGFLPNQGFKNVQRRQACISNLQSTERRLVMLLSWC